MRESTPLCWCIKHRSYKPTGHDGAEDNGDESAVNAEECYTIRVRQPLQNTASPVPTIWIVKNKCLQIREMGSQTKQQTETHNSNGVYDEDEGKISDTLMSE